MWQGRKLGKQIVELVLTVFEIVAPVFLLAGAGFAWVKLGFEYQIQFVTRLAMTLGIPALIFTALMKTEIEPQALTTVSLATLAAHGALGLVMYALVRATRMEICTYLSPLIFGNTGNLGLPVALFAFGDEGLGYAVVIFAVSAILVFTVGIWLVSGGGSPARVLREPMVVATLLGALFMAFDWETPRFLTNALDLLGQLAIPLMLITLGVAVSRLHPARMGRAVWLSLAKAAAAVALAWSVGLVFGLAPVPFAVLVLQISTPVPVTAYLLAEKYHADAGAVAGLVVISTLVSVAAIPLTLALLI
jgi:predicted permease